MSNISFAKISDSASLIYSQTWSLQPPLRPIGPQGPAADCLLKPQIHLTNEPTDVCTNDCMRLAVACTGLTVLFHSKNYSFSNSGFQNTVTSQLVIKTSGKTKLNLGLHHLFWGWDFLTWCKCFSFFQNLQSNILNIKSAIVLHSKIICDFL